MEKHEYGGKGRRVKYWPHLGCWISPYYGPFSLGERFESYELFISLFFKNFFQAADSESVDTGAHLY
jgi:hypothetical protein